MRFATVVVQTFRTTSYRLIGRMCWRSLLPGIFGASLISLSLNQVGHALQDHILFICLNMKRRTAGFHALNMLGVASERPGADPERRLSIAVDDSFSKRNFLTLLIYFWRVG